MPPLSVHPPSDDERSRRKYVVHNARRYIYRAEGCDPVALEVTGDASKLPPNVTTMATAMFWSFINAPSFYLGTVEETTTIEVAIRAGASLKKIISATKDEVQQAARYFEQAIAATCDELGVGLEL